MRISDWSSDACSSDLLNVHLVRSALASQDSARSLSALSASFRRVSPLYSSSASRYSGFTRVNKGLSTLAAWSTLTRSVPPRRRDRKSVVEGKGVSGRVDLGGSGRIKKKKTRTFQS